jgi:hypothetical protein
VDSAKRGMGSTAESVLDVELSKLIADVGKGGRRSKGQYWLIQGAGVTKLDGCFVTTLTKSLHVMHDERRS